MGLLILVLLGGALASTLLIPRGTPNPPAATAIGTVKFSGATTGIYDHITLDMPEISAPPAGKTYYAWIESAKNEGSPPHWKLNMSQQGIHAELGKPYPDPPNLLRDGWVLVITTETRVNPVVSSPLAEDRLYYALLSDKRTTFDLLKCPANDTQRVCL
jgi:hypothetical protein